MDYSMNIEELKAAAASVTGRSHRRQNGLCEDAYAIDSLKTRSGKIFREAVVVCDGAGSCRFGRLGARIASHVAARWLLEHFHVIQCRDISSEKIARCLIAVIQRCIRKFAISMGFPDVLKPFSCTLLAAVMNWDGRWVTVHIGDGGIVGLGEDGPFIISGPAKGEYANVTFFVTEKNAFQKMKVERNNRPVRAFALFTDGLENSLIRASESRIAPAMSQILTWLDDSNPAEVTDALHTALEEVFLQQTTDDCTLAILAGV